MKTLVLLTLLLSANLSKADESNAKLEAGRSMQCVTAIEFSTQGHTDLIDKLQTKLNELIKTVESDSSLSVSSLSAPAIQLNAIAGSGYLFGSACVTINIENRIRSSPR